MSLRPNSVAQRPRYAQIVCRSTDSYRLDQFSDCKIFYSMADSYAAKSTEDPRYLSFLCTNFRSPIAYIKRNITSLSEHYRQLLHLSPIWKQTSELRRPGSAKPCAVGPAPYDSTGLTSILYCHWLSRLHG